MNKKTPKAPVGIENAYDVMEKIKKDAAAHKPPQLPAKAVNPHGKPAVDSASPATVTASPASGNKARAPQRQIPQD